MHIYILFFYLFEHCISNLKSIQYEKNEKNDSYKFFFRWLTFENDHVVKWNIEDKNNPYEYKMWHDEITQNETMIL